MYFNSVIIFSTPDPEEWKCQKLLLLKNFLLNKDDSSLKLEIRVTTATIDFTFFFIVKRHLLSSLEFHLIVEDKMGQ